MPQRAFRTPRVAISFVVLVILGLSSCGPAPVPSGIDDPYETQNRKTHEFNLAVDKNVIRPLSRGAFKVIPKPVSRGVANFGNNLSLPGEVLNDLFQVRLENAVHNTLRFAFNTTIGIGGLLDPATPMGLPERPTDFGETMTVWGTPEGRYLELPVLGPSTERDAFGKVVDLVLDPTRTFIPRDKAWIGTTAKVVARIDERGRYSETFDSVLYDSADGYAQARLMYLQHRRYNLGQASASSEFEDPYAK
ncbi:MAG: VacJ family lipoprotein [Cypionkella sp.]